MQCEVCGRKAEGRFCGFHESAYQNIQDNFEAWRVAMNVSWTEYLKRIEENPLTGIWAKEVVKYFLSSEISSKEKAIETQINKT